MGFYSQYKSSGIPVVKSIGAILAQMEEDGVPIRIIESVIVDGERKQILYGSIVYASFEYIDDKLNIYYASFTPRKKEEL